MYNVSYYIRCIIQEGSVSKHKTYLTTEFSKIIVIGFYYNSEKKFRKEYSDFMTADCINLWKGKVWGVLKTTGKRVLLKSVTN